MPGDLNLKKSWHPGLMKNQKKIWDEEQNKLNELKKIKQRNGELNDEREKLELMKLQYGDDLKNLPNEEKLKLNKLNWMYDDPTVKNEAGLNEMSEEFLLGKSHVENLLNNNKAFSVSNTNRIEKVLGSGKPEKINIKAYDDPLSKIKNEQMKMRAKLKGTSSRRRELYKSGSSSHGVSKSGSGHRSTRDKYHSSEHRTSSDHSSSHYRKHKNRNNDLSNHFKEKNHQIGSNSSLQPSSSAFK